MRLPAVGATPPSGYISLAGRLTPLRGRKLEMNTQLAFMGDGHHMGFFALVIVGGLAGWIAGMITGMRHGILTNILVGIAGSYIAAELALLANIVVTGTVGHLVAAIIGAIIVTYLWQMLRGNTSRV